MARIDTHEAAKRDLIEQFVYLAEHAGLDVADRFLSNAEESFHDLAAHPHMGAPIEVSHRDLVGVRKWRVRDFEDVLIFYQPTDDGIAIVRVLRAERDWWTLLGLA